MAVPPQNYTQDPHVSQQLRFWVYAEKKARIRDVHNVHMLHYSR